MDGGLGSVIVDGNLLVATALAVLAGVVSFASPCVLPLVPGFLGYVTGMGEAAVPRPRRTRGSGGSGEIGAEISTGQMTGPDDAAGAVAVAADPSVERRQAAARRRVLIGAALFVAGFSLVFVTGTLLASVAGAALAAHRELISRVGGLLVIAMALVFLGVGAGVGSQRSWQPRWRPATGLAGAPLLGVVFGIGWAPCMGPTYAAIALLATNLAGESGQVARGAVLGVAYCLGLGLPFLFIAAGWSRAMAASTWLRRHHRGIQLFSGALLLVIGVLLVSGLWDQLITQLQIRLVSTYITPL